MAGIAEAVQTAGGGVVRFLQWWSDELRGLMPQSLQAEAAGKVIVTAGPDGYGVLEGTGGKLQATANGTALSAIDAVAAASEAVRRNPAAEVGIRVPLESCFVRHVELPSSAQQDAARILDLDLERATPFKLKDVYTAALVEDTDSRSARVRVRHMMVKREAVEPVLGELEASGVPVAFIDCWSEREGRSLPVNFLATQRAAPKGARATLSFVAWLALGVASLAVLAVLLAESRYQAALASVQEQVAAARAKATNVRRALDTSEAALTEIGRLQGLKLTAVPAVEIVDALTKLLPDTVWLTELRYENGNLDITGFAKSGAGLLPLFEGSALFADATLASGVNFDPQQNKERFTLRVRVRQPGGPERTATKDGREKR